MLAAQGLAESFYKKTAHIALKRILRLSKNPRRPAASGQGQCPLEERCGLKTSLCTRKGPEGMRKQHREPRRMSAFGGKADIAK